MARIRAMAAMEPIAVPAMARGDRVLEGLAARAYLNVKIWFVMVLTEIPGEAIVVGGTSGRERLLTQGVSPARAEVWMDHPLLASLVLETATHGMKDSRRTTGTARPNVICRTDAKLPTVLDDKWTTAWIFL